MAKVQSAEDLKDWKEYRTFLKERARALPEDGCAFYVSKDKFDFDINGKSWSGYAILFDKKGTLAVQNLKKDQIKFREGTCTLRDGDFVIAGLAPNFVNFAEKTLLKMKLGYGAVPAGPQDMQPPAPPAEDEGNVDDPRLRETLKRLEKKNLPRARELASLVPDSRRQITDSLEEASAAKEGGADDPKLQALLKHLKKKNLARAQQMARLVPDSRSQIAESLREAADAERSGDVQAAVEAHEILGVFLDSLESEAAEGGAADPKLQAHLKELKDRNGKRAKIVGDLTPDARKDIAASLEEAAKAEKAGDVKGAVDAHEILDAYLTSLESEILE